MHYNTGMTKVSELKKLSVLPGIPEDDTCFHVYIYRNDHGQEITGHVDIAVGNTLVSYGCHDPKHRLPLFLKGDGVLIQADRKAFLKHESVPGEMIIDYALNLSKEQMHAFLKKSDGFFEHMIPWQPSGKEDYASILDRDIHPSFHKLKNHRYTEYNLFHNNCVTFVNDCIRDWLPGYHAWIQTPASFRNFMDSAYQKHNPLIHSRTIWYTPSEKR